MSGAIYKKYSPYLLLAVGLLWMWFSRSAPGQTTGGGIPAPYTGFQAPDFSLQTAAGGAITLSELRGQPVLVNFWASWCPPCRAEMPAFENAYQALKDQGFIILAINATNQDTAEKALAFVEEYGLTFPILFDNDGQVFQSYQVRSLPTSFFIDPQGTIREVVIGGPMAEALLHVRITQLLENPFPEAP